MVREAASSGELQPKEALSDDLLAFKQNKPLILQLWATLVQNSVKYANRRRNTAYLFYYHSLNKTREGLAP